jgi:hypothetical protein
MLKGLLFIFIDRISLAHTIGAGEFLLTFFQL